MECRAEPLAGDSRTKKLAEVVSEFPDTPVVDGIPWFCWDWGGHHRTALEGGYYSNYCHLTDGECWYEGSGLMCNDTMRAYAEGGCDDNIIFEALEKSYGWWFTK